MYWPDNATWKACSIEQLLLAGESDERLFAGVVNLYNLKSILGGQSYLTRT